MKNFNKFGVDLNIHDHNSDDQSLINDNIKDEITDGKSFFILNLDKVYEKFKNWAQKLPRVKTFYAVKCNNDLVLLRFLANLGCNFDCASKNEIQTVLDLDVSSNRIIYANPCKQSSYIKFAKEHSISCMTFDSEDELIKIKELYPTANLVLRIITDDRNATHKLSEKFGANMKLSYKLIKSVFDQNLKLIGISFHIGSGNDSPDAFLIPIKNARTLFDHVKEKYNHNLNLLDIGGGFPGFPEQDDLFDKMALNINKLLETNFSDLNVDIIAEPGRYYVSSAFTLAVNIISKRRVEDEAEISFMYYINDSIYSTFASVLTDIPRKYPPIFLNIKEKDSKETWNSTMFGATCDCIDVIFKNYKLPELNIGEYIAFSNMGAYTSCLATSFNGIELPIRKYTISKKCLDEVK